MNQFCRNSINTWRIIPFQLRSSNLHMKRARLRCQRPRCKYFHLPNITNLITFNKSRCRKRIDKTEINRNCIQKHERRQNYYFMRHWKAHTSYNLSRKPRCWKCGNKQTNGKLHTDVPQSLKTEFQILTNCMNISDCTNSKKLCWIKH